MYKEMPVIPGKQGGGEEERHKGSLNKNNANKRLKLGLCMYMYCVISTQVLDMKGLHSFGIEGLSPEIGFKLNCC
jgi:hypothetical protein